MNYQRLPDKIERQITKLQERDKALIEKFITDELAKGKCCLQNIIDFLIKNILFSCLPNIEGLKSDTVCSQKRIYCVLYFDKMQSESGKPVRVIYDITEKDMPFKIGERDECENESSEDTVTQLLSRNNSSVFETAAINADEQLINGENGTNEEQSN